MRPRLVHRKSLSAPMLIRMLHSISRVHSQNWKRERLFADGLADLMSLARNEETIVRGKHRNCPRDRQSPVAYLFDIFRPRRAATYGPADRGRISERGLSSVTMTICEVGRYFPHWPFAGITVATTAKDHDEPSSHKRPQCLERFIERVRLMRIIDKDRRTISPADQLETARRTFELF